MMDETAIKFRRYMAYAVVIFLWAIFLVVATRFFIAVTEAKRFLQIP